ncbi:MAG: hypothetical protein B5M53_12600 [Candidatus Cloacimonas sp. 4484_209]|nr:MAG: hypothetical protein B5M53_12600 [Candidatus Cloacimonas sp. 4484_209]
MIVTMPVDAKEEEIAHVLKTVERLGYESKLFQGEKKTVIHIWGATDKDKLTKKIELLSGVERMIPILYPFKLASREFHPDDTVISIDRKTIGGNKLAIIAGPCAFESEKNLMTIADVCMKAGAQFLRGGILKPWTSPYSFQGLGEKGLEILARVRERTGLLIVTEVMSEVDVPLLSQYVDIFQIGARNMQNFTLLKTVGRFAKPV